MGSGCGDPTVEKFPSSSGQLPVPVALNAGSPTLFRDYYTTNDRKCKDLFRYFKIKSLCHSEERSDEESFRSFAFAQDDRGESPSRKEDQWPSRKLTEIEL